MSKEKDIKLTRKDLYMRVWKEPMRSLAIELGMSDVGLRKLCRRNGIPTPPQGYHLMSEGHRKERLVKQLPDPTEEQEANFIFKKNEEATESTSDEMDLEWLDLVNKSTNNPEDKQVKQVQKVLKSITSQLNKKKLDERGIIRKPIDNFPIRTSPAMLENAVNTLENLFKRLVTMGASLPKTVKSDSRLILMTQWKDYEFSFRVEEFTNRFEVPISERPKQSYTLYGDQWKYVPTGKLTIEVNGPGYGSMTMRDGRKTINERMDELIKRMFTQAYEQNITDRLHEVRKENTIEHLKRKDLIRREKEFQALRKKKLIKDSIRFRRVKELRAYLEEIETSDEVIFESEDDKSKWLEWAEEYADSIDPINQRSASIFPDFPEPKEITDVPWFYLDFDDPIEAEGHRKKNHYWWNDGEL